MPQQKYATKKKVAIECGTPQSEQNQLPAAGLWGYRPLKVRQTINQI